MKQYMELTPPAAEWMTTYHSLPEDTRLYLFALLLEHMEMGLVNSKNAVEEAELNRKDVTILLIMDIDIGDGSVLASEIFGMLPKKAGEAPASRMPQAPVYLDIAEPFINPDTRSDDAHSHFYALDYGDKLLVLGELFSLVRMMSFLSAAASFHPLTTRSAAS